MIVIRIIPHKEQRYPTVGDWRFEDSSPETGDPDISVCISQLGVPDYNFLVAIHELVEAYLCWKRNIGEAEVTDFDLVYEATRPENDKAEPGNHPLAPYRKEHVFATAIERRIAKELGVDWNEYEKAIWALD